MEIIVAVNEDVVREAFKRAETVEIAQDRPDAKLYSMSSAVKAAVGDTWLKIKRVVEECLRTRWELVQASVQEVLDYITATANGLGNDAIFYREILIVKMREIISSTFDLILSSLRTEIKVGEHSYRLKTVELQQKLVFTGSIELSLTTLCKFVSSGELSVQGSYEAPAASETGRLPAPL
jgi:hypothetical protein